MNTASSSANHVSIGQPNPPLVSNFSGNHSSVSHALYHTQCLSPSPSWILDTGATDHMVSSLHFLTTITHTVHIKIKLPNSQYVFAIHLGTIKLKEGFVYPMSFTFVTSLLISFLLVD